MNKALEKATEEAARVKALLAALELTAKDIEVRSCDMDVVDNAAHLLYMAQEEAEKTIRELEKAQRGI